jgi:hypothetical protein
MHFKSNKSSGTMTMLQYSGLKKLFPCIICFLLCTFVTLAGCSYTLPQDTDLPQHNDLAQYTDHPQHSNIPQSTYQKPSLEAPEVTLKSPQLILIVDNMSLSTDGLDLNLQARVFNPNTFSIDIDDLKVFTRDAAGMDSLLDTVPGGPIKSASMRTFNSGVILANDLLYGRKLTIGINTRTVNTDKILPVSATTEINIPETLNKLIINPKITAQANITKISWNGFNSQLEAQVEGNIENPNPLSLHYNIIRIIVKDKKGEAIAADDIPGGSIAANSDYPFTRLLILPIRVMSETSVSVDIGATIQIPDYIQTLKCSVILPIPKLRELISVPQIKLDTSAVWVTTSPAPIFKMTIVALINNDNKIDLTTGDLKLNIYKLDHTLISSIIMSYKVIQGIKSSSTATLTNWVNLSPDIVGPVAVNVTITAETNVSVEGVSEKIPLNANMVFKLVPQHWRY